jgi:hypothetical protein
MRPAGRGTLNFLYLVIKSDYSDIAPQHNFLIVALDVLFGSVTRGFRNRTVRGDAPGYGIIRNHHA